MAPRSISSSATPQTNPEVDFYCENHGSIYLLRSVSPPAFSWIKENLRNHLTFAGAVVVEHRYIADFVRGAIADGLVVR